MPPTVAPTCREMNRHGGSHHPIRLTWLVCPGQRSLYSRCNRPCLSNGPIGNLWRRESESNRRPRLCRPLHNHSAIPPCIARRFARPATAKHCQRHDEISALAKLKRENGPVQPYVAMESIFPLESGAGNESRTRDLNLGKVALYQLSYSRKRKRNYRAGTYFVKEHNHLKMQQGRFAQFRFSAWPRAPLEQLCAGSRPSTIRSRPQPRKSARCQSDAHPERRSGRCRAKAGWRSSGPWFLTCR